MSQLLTLTTDFGLSDSYVAQIKGVVLSIAPQVRIIDISHSIPPFDIQSGARVLAEAAPHFPSDTVHVAVIDPGVGGTRKRLIIETSIYAPHENRSKRQLFVGPDNGLLTFAAPSNECRRVWSIEDLSLLPKFSDGRTFEGRNIFSPVAALLASGMKPENFGPCLEADSQNKSEIIEMMKCKEAERSGERILGSILSVDHYGNIATNIAKSLLQSFAREGFIEDRAKIIRFVTHFSDLKSGELGCLINSQGYLEFVVNFGSAAADLQLKTGDSFQLLIR